jgi:ribosome-associated protein
MQPAIREYYHLEELWGDKPVRMKIGAAPPTRLVKAAPTLSEAKSNAIRRASSEAKSKPVRRAPSAPAPAKSAKRPAARPAAPGRRVVRTVGVKSAGAAARPAAGARRAPAKKTSAKR